MSAGSPCQECGACCDHSAEWPRFSTESEAELALIPARFVGLNGMRCVGTRCSALHGVVGERTRCGIYAVRPDVCRTCEPGDDECRTAREAIGLPALEVA